MNTAQDIIEHLELIPHPEGGFYKETFRSEGSISKSELGEDYSGERSYSSAIYFLLTSDSFSAFHRIKQDEFWHHYDGAAINVHVIDSNGIYSCTRVGKGFKNGEVPQFVVKGGSWFASEVSDNSSFSLVGCTVSPGFDFNDFELAERPELIETYPEHLEVISRLTR